MPASYRSPKTALHRSSIHGRGLFAVRPIARGEIVAIKGGHILDRDTLRRARARIAESYLQIDDGFYIGALRPAEVRRNKIFINHSCEPNLGLRGQITFVARRAIKAGEELTYDWAMEENSPALTRCTCGQPSCRKILTGRDWRKPALQRRYRGYFAAYLQERITDGQERMTDGRRPRRSRRR
jgi:SET domain-containing protein